MRRRLPYYEKSRRRPVSEALVAACDQLDPSLPLIATDCGCGGGRELGYLLERGFEVHAFDISWLALAKCREQFGDYQKMHLTEASFETFHYPPVSLLHARASLCYCAREVFPDCWQVMTRVIHPGGLLVASFLGPNDTWASQAPGNETFSPGPIATYHPDEVRELLQDFEIVEFRDEEEDAPLLGSDTVKHWHILTVIARKKASP